MSTISEFKNAMVGGGARANQFRVELSFPSVVASGSLAAANAQFLCKGAQLPGSTIANIPVAYRGKTINIAGEREFAPWAISIYNDVDFAIRNAFEQWLNAINNHTKLGGETQPGAYQADLVVHQLDKNDAVLKTYKFIDAYPIEVGPIQLDYEQSNQIEIFDVNFQYNYWTSNTTTESAS